jgi:hypothetical protein
MRWLETEDMLHAINPAHLTHMEVKAKHPVATVTDEFPQEWAVLAFTAHTVPEVGAFVLSDHHRTEREATRSMQVFLDQIGVLE